MNTGKNLVRDFTERSEEEHLSQTLELLNEEGT